FDKEKISEIWQGIKQHFKNEFYDENNISLHKTNKGLFAWRIIKNIILVGAVAIGVTSTVLFLITLPNFLIKNVLSKLGHRISQAIAGGHDILAIWSFFKLAAFDILGWFKAKVDAVENYGRYRKDV